MSSVRVVVHGIVQGVGFRYSARAEAERLGITGWIRNRSDGAVEAEIGGDAEDVQRMLDWLGRGPRGAAVASLDVSDPIELGELPGGDDAGGEGGEFRIVP
ncbi:acylphosphatase [Microterricola gilva]|uniref:acylphosphatase n=1 Tax=Microterricola gilva TaxID=393267 RepID=A0A4Q8APP5_9MICO|nr:acylphosphatase [Microterricola gilva]RZU65995.1 acylphosphatase [Microterricola gilva]